MVDPAKDQFYQQRLASWGYPGPQHHLPPQQQQQMYGNNSHNFAAAAAAGLIPPSNHGQGFKDHGGGGGYSSYPAMHLAALSAAAVAASDFSRPLPAHSPATASGMAASASNAPLPAHMTRNPYQASSYHNAYVPNYYNGRDQHGSQPPNGYNPSFPPQPPQPQTVYNLSKPREDCNGYKPPVTSTPAPTSNHPPFQPFMYPQTAQPSYHYPFDMSKLSYQFGQQQQQQPQHHQQQSQMLPHQRQSVLRNPFETEAPPTASAPALVQPRGPLIEGDRSFSNGVNRQAAPPHHQQHSDPLTKYNPFPYSMSQFAPPQQPSAIHKLLPQQPHQLRPPTSSYLPPPHEAHQPSATISTSTTPSQPFLTTTTSQVPNTINRPQEKKLFDHEAIKRKAEVTANEPETKKAKTDPYSFDEEESKTAAAAAYSGVEFTRFGLQQANSPVASPGPNSGNATGYKFKSALLSRNCSFEVPPKLSSKSVPLTFEVHSNLFAEACDRFVEDMVSRPMSVSKRASVESFMAAQAARASKKAECKAEKEKQKAEAAERRAEREERKEKEKLGLLPPQEKTPKKRGRKSKRDIQRELLLQQQEHLLQMEAAAKAAKESGATSAEEDVKENKPASGTNDRNATDEKPASAPNVNNNNNATTLVKDEKPKKSGGTWALPIVPKMPQKMSNDKRKGLAPLPNIPSMAKAKKLAATSDSGAKKSIKGGSTEGLANVWLQAFGAKPAPNRVVKQEPGLTQAPGSSSMIASDKPVAKKTFLDIPPEKRRRPRPNFGGLIHFSPDWEKAVQRHHEKSRMPSSLVEGIKVKPQILKSLVGGVQLCGSISQEPSASSSIDAKEDSRGKYAALSSYLGSPTHSSDPGSPPPFASAPQKEAPSNAKAYPYLTVKGSEPNDGMWGLKATDEGIASVVGSILEHRKKLRASHAISRMYKVSPFFARKKPPKEEKYDEGIRLMSTPGLPDMEEASDESLMRSYSNFRRQTLLRYLDETINHSPELKAKILDWKPAVLENKTRHQANKAREVTAYREIFGLDLPGAKKAKKAPRKKKGSKTETKKLDLSDDGELTALNENETSTVQPTQSKAVAGEKPKKAPRKSKKSLPTEPVAPMVEKNAPLEDPEESFVPTQAEEELQTELQTYALDLLETNSSWERRTVIQNLVIWEPVTDPALLIIPPNIAVPGTVPGLAVPINAPVPGMSRRRTKKVRKRQSGMDFSKKKTTATGKNSKDVSRAHSPTHMDETDGTDCDKREVVHTLAKMLSDSKHMVMDKSAGETILHRAAKMGYPDVAAYALDRMKMTATVKDNAGFPPIHKAAMKGHAEIVDYFIRYGADPNTNVKGTRPLHEALEGGHIKAVATLLRHGSDPLLYDYSGNMPIDLAKDSEDPDLLNYFSAILNDLHGKPASRWRVSHDRSFILPTSGVDELDLPKLQQETDDAQNDFDFEVSAQPLPPQFKFPQHPDDYFVLASDLKKLTNQDVTKLGSKFTLQKMSREDFMKTAFCCLLGVTVDPGKSEPIVLVKVDAALGKLMGVDDSKLYNSLSCTVSPTKKKSS